MLNGLPEPIPDLDTQPFWDGCKERRFLVPHCEVCDTPRWPPGPCCPNCQSQATKWLEAEPRGSVYSWIVVTHSVHQATHNQVPYIAALVELGSGIRVIGNIVECDPADMAAGMPVDLIFEQTESGAFLPNFRPST